MPDSFQVPANRIIYYFAIPAMVFRSTALASLDKEFHFGVLMATLLASATSSKCRPRESRLHRLVFFFVFPWRNRSGKNGNHLQRPGNSAEYPLGFCVTALFRKKSDISDQGDECTRQSLQKPCHPLLSGGDIGLRFWVATPTSGSPISGNAGKCCAPNGIIADRRFTALSQYQE